MRKWNYVAMGRSGFQGSRRRWQGVSQLDLEKDRTPGGPGPGLIGAGFLAISLIDFPARRLCRRCRKGRTLSKRRFPELSECHPVRHRFRQSVASRAVCRYLGCSPGVVRPRRCPRR